MGFDLKTFKKDLQQNVEQNGRDVDLLLISSMLLADADVQDLFRKAGVDIEKMKKGLKLETQHSDAARKRKEERDEEEMDAHEFEKKKAERWADKANDEHLHRFIDAVELSAAMEGRTPTAVDAIKQMVSLSEDEHHGGVETFRILNVDFHTIFPDLASQRLATTQRQRAPKVAQDIKEWTQLIDGVAGALSEKYPGLKSMLASDPKFARRVQAER